MSAAIHTRGKTVEQMQSDQAEAERKDAEPYCTITLSRKQAREFEDATNDAEYLLINAGAIFEMLHLNICSGGIDPTTGGLSELLEMVGRGFKAAAEDEGAKITELSGCIRSRKELIHETDK